MYLILSRRSDLVDVKNTRSYHSADCDTDHALTSRCKEADKVSEFLQIVEMKLSNLKVSDSTEETRTSFKTVVYDSVTGI